MNSAALLDCPGIDRLESLLAGGLEERESQSIELHIESCTACQQRLEGLTTVDDPLWLAAAGGLASHAPPPRAHAERGHAGRQALRASSGADGREAASLELVELQGRGAAGSGACAPQAGTQEGEDPAAAGTRRSPALAETTWLVQVAEQSWLERTPAPVLPQRLGEFELQECAGRGGMGVVYRARDIRLDRTVAVKVLVEGAHATLAVRARFLTEARAAARLAHPNIVQIYEVGQAGDQAFLALEYLARGTLADRLAAGPFSAHAAAELVATLARAIHAAHQQGIVHRDLKPENVLFSAEGTPKIGDFGLARLADGEGLTRSDEIMGTASYMAPEQARGGHQVGPAADVYALGAILYALLTGRPPFHAATRLDTLLLVRDQEPVPPRRLQPGFPRDLETICLRALAKEPGRRYASAAAMADDLGRFLRHQPIVARPAGVVERAAKWSRRNRAAAISIASISATLVAATLVSLYYAWRAGQFADRMASALVNEQRAREALEEGVYTLAVEKAATALKERRYPDVSAAFAVNFGGRIGWECHRMEFEAHQGAAYPIRCLGEHDWSVLDAAISPDGKKLITSGADGRVLLWELTGDRAMCKPRVLQEGRWSQERLRWKHAFEDPPSTDWPPPYLCAVDLCWPPGTTGNSPTAAKEVFVASLDGRGMSIDVASGAQRPLIKRDEPLYCTAASDGGTLVLFGSESGHLLLVENKNGDSKQIAEVKAPSPALAAAWWSGGQSWVVGLEDGTVLVLDGRSLELKASRQVDGPVWSLDLFPHGKQALLAVGCQAARLSVYAIEAVEGQRSIMPYDEIRVPPGVWLASGIESVRFAGDGDVIALDNVGQLMRWDRDEKQIAWIQRAVGERDLNAGPRGWAEERGWKVPRPMERIGTVAAITPQEQILLASREKSVTVWEFPQAESTWLESGESPQIVFDQRQLEVLWALTFDGHLDAIDSQTKKRIDRKAAHERGNALTVLPGTDLIVTVGEDKALRSWRLARHKIEEGPLAIRTARALLSVAASHDGRMLAAVDASSKLFVWDARDSRELVSKQLGEALRPLRGCVAFNADGSRLAACGAGQHCSVLSTQTFERIDDEIELSGGGGLALAWHASDPNFLLAADDYPRIVGSPRSPEIEQRLGIIGRSKKCVAIVPRSGPDRWFVLEETGEVLIGNARQPARLWTVQSHGSAACSLAMDASGKRLAVAHDDGRIEVLESERRAPSPEEGFERVELRLTERLLTAAPRPAGLSGGSMALSDSANDQEALRIREAVAVDSRGRVAVAALRRRGDKADLVYLAEDDRGGTLEEVVDQMASPGPPTMCLKFDGRDRPHIVYRVEAADTEDDYDGRLRMARRTAAGRWTLEELAGLGNHGYTPNVVFHPDGRAEVLHFDLDTYRLWRASQVGGIWENQTVGRQGDGFNPHAALDRGGNLWMAWRVNRFNGDRSPAILGRWIGGRLEREVIDPGAAAVNQFVLQSDGSVAVLADSLSAEVRTKLAQRDSSGRWHTEPLPLRAPINLCRMTEHGDIYALEAFTGRWTLKWRARGKWRQSYAGGLQSDHSAKLVLDHRSRPVIVVPPEPASPNVVRVFRADWDGLEPGGAATESVD